MRNNHDNDDSRKPDNNNDDEIMMPDDSRGDTHSRVVTLGQIDIDTSRFKGDPDLAHMPVLPTR